MCLLDPAHACSGPSQRIMNFVVLWLSLRVRFKSSSLSCIYLRDLGCWHRLELDDHGRCYRHTRQLRALCNGNTLVVRRLLSPEVCAHQHADNAKRRSATCKCNDGQARIFFTDISEHADGERRGSSLTRRYPTMDLIKNSRIDPVVALGLHRRHAPKEHSALRPRRLRRHRRLRRMHARRERLMAGDPRCTFRLSCRGYCRPRHTWRHFSSRDD